MNSQSAAHEQAQMWNGPSGQAWIEQQQALDRMFEPIEALLAVAVSEAGATSVLDVGCGTGATTLAAARQVRPPGRCVGVDISAPMIAVARERAARVRSTAEFLVADAGGLSLDAGVFDLVISRFGVMFFADPDAAFANLRRACVPGASLRCVAWRSAAENSFMTTAERSAAPLLPPLPPRPADGPGQFAFADAAKVRGILERAGWREVELRPLDVVCAFDEDELDTYITKLGPVSRVLAEVDAPRRERAIAAMRTAFAPFVRAGKVSYTAACWMLCARS